MGMAIPILVKRLRNDLSGAADLGIDVPDIPDSIDLPFAIDITLHDTEAFSAPETPCPEQRFTIFIGEDYPYERPKVRWNTEVFHPNIMPHSEGGSVCVAELDHWTFDSNLKEFIETLIDLVDHPNPFNPLANPTCAAAAEWFLDRL